MKTSREKKAEKALAAPTAEKAITVLGLVTNTAPRWPINGQDAHGVYTLVDGRRVRLVQDPTGEYIPADPNATP